MNTKAWLFQVSIIIVGGLIVVAISALVAQKKYEDSVSTNPLLSFLGK
jgi:hypothetical protein